MGAVVMTLAMRVAINAVEREMRAQGLKIAHIKRHVITAAANTYLFQHPELIEEAAETVRKVPQLRTLYEREMCQRRRNQR
jgi:hypothetical protein